MVFNAYAAAANLGYRHIVKPLHEHVHARGERERKHKRTKAERAHEYKDRRAARKTRTRRQYQDHAADFVGSLGGVAARVALNYAHHKAGRAHRHDIRPHLANAAVSGLSGAYRTYRSSSRANADAAASYATRSAKAAREHTAANDLHPWSDTIAGIRHVARRYHMAG